MPRGQYDREAAAVRKAGETVAPTVTENVIVRPTRADEVRQERRKKPGTSGPSRIRLSVDEKKLDRNTYHYRFANDKEGRVKQLMAEDYDIAPEEAKSDTSSLGTVNSTFAGKDDSGKPYDAVLMRKRKDWFDVDQKEKMRPLDEQDEAIRRNNPNHKGNDLRGPAVYTPGTNTIERA